MGFWHRLFRRRRRSRVLAASSVPAVATSTVAAPVAPEQTGPAPLAQRQYLEDVPYLLPKDPLEDQRLNYQHHALLRTLGNHSLAPLAPESTRTILDVGTGTGIWACEMQALFPHAIVVGVDVSLQSLPQPVPPTCVFVRANVLEGLPFPDGQFTFTHQRLLVAAIPAQAWPGVVRELVRVTWPAARSSRTPAVRASPSLRSSPHCGILLCDCSSRSASIPSQRAEQAARYLEVRDGNRQRSAQCRGHSPLPRLALRPLLPRTPSGKQL